MNTFLEIRERWQAQNAHGTAPSVALYIAGALTQISGLIAASYQIAETSFAYFTITLTLVGMATAYFARRVGVSPRFLRGGALLLGLVFLLALRGAGLFGAMVPVESQGSQEVLLVSALAFTATFCTFLLVTDESVIFTCVWAIAIIGLTGTIDINRPLIVCFCLFLVGASFLLIHQNALAQAAGGTNAQGVAPRRAAPKAFLLSWPLLRRQIGMAAAVWATALLLGFCIALPIQMVGRNLSLGKFIQRLRVPAAASTRLQGSVSLAFDNLSNFNVGLGPVNDDPTARMSVLSDGPQYYRGRAYDFYNGHGWDSSISLARTQIFPTPDPKAPNNWSRFEVPLRQNELPRKKTVQITNRFHLINTGAYGPIYHASEPVRVFAPADFLYARPDHTIGAGRGSGYGGDYQVESLISDAKPSDLRASSRAYPTDISLTYLNQGTSSDVLQALSDEAVGDFTDPFGKAQAIKRFIAARCIYSRDARAVPKDRDAVEFFLNDSREGYCDLYASAMAMLARYAGLPARVVTGFAPGTPIEGQETGPDGKPEKRTRYLMRGSDLHAWAEIYFVDYGWIRFDATEDTGSIAPPPTTPKPADPPKGLERLLRREKVPLSFAALGILGLLFVIANETRERVRFPYRKNSRTGGGSENARALGGIYAGAVRLVEKKAKLRRDRAFTTGDYEKIVRTHFGENSAASDAFTHLTRLAEQGLYGPETVGEAEVKASRAALRALKAALRRAKPVAPVQGVSDVAA